MLTTNNYICTIYTRLDTCLMSSSRFSLWDKVTLRLMRRIFYIADVVEWSRALDIRLSDWCCNVSMMWVQIPSREEQKFDRSKTLRKRRYCPWVNICVAGALIGWPWQIQNLYHWPQSKLERKSKTKKREFLDPRVTNITSGRHKQKGLNLLFFLPFNNCLVLR